jgi:diguanylate cyclase (GGDEF)-like protein
MAQSKQTILIVDDVPSNIKLLNTILENEGEIIFATRGLDGLNMAFKQRPDLILLDVVLPDIDGIEICKQLKAAPETAAIPVIFITAMSQEADEERGLGAGAIDYITKPFSTSIVRARVRNHLELKRYRDMLESLSTTDGLTGIPNRRQFDDFLDREWRRAIRNHTPISLIMMDIDFFKAYNDYYGHLEGDNCLRQLARALFEIARRPVDLAARYGGEEFAFVIPETDTEGAMNVAIMIRDRINALNLPHARSTVADYVTISIGVATIVPVVGQLSEELIRLADERLYVAKQSGRNRIQND